MRKMEDDDHLVLKDDIDDEKGASIQKINEIWRPNKFFGVFELKIPQLQMCSCKQYFDGCQVDVYG